MLRISFIFYLTFLYSFANAQLSEDSLWNIWKNSEQPDSNRLKAINLFLYQGFLFNNPDSAFKLAQERFELASKSNSLRDMAGALNSQGIASSIQGNFSTGIEYFSKSFDISKKILDTLSMANALNNLGILNNDQGNLDEALIFYQRSLELFEAIHDKTGMASALVNIGIIHTTKEEYGKAEPYIQKAIGIEKELGDQWGLASSYQNLASLYASQGKLSIALDNFQKSLLICKEVQDQQGIAFCLNNIGNIYSELGEYQKSIEYSSKALKLSEEIGVAKIQQEALKDLSEAYQNISNYKLSLEMYKKYVLIRDSIIKEENQEELIKQEYKFQYDLKAAADSLKAAEAKKVSDAQIAAQNAQLKQERTQRFALIGGLGLLGLFGGLMFNRFKVTQKQRDIITSQKREVDHANNALKEKNREILDSIDYAKRIQNAILPPSRLVKEYLIESFILYKPKDVVAGDFYWMEAIDDLVIFAVADCTGHGVPGAMVSVICVNGLNRSVREFGLREPNLILDKTRELVIKEFEKSEEEVKDGMDISLCVLNSKTNALRWAGAHNPLWLIRKDASELEELKADKQPIGQFELSKPFSKHELKLNEGDSIYLFSDGFIDQFGGDLGKKYKSKNFKNFLLSITDHKMDEQKELIEKEFNNWKGDEEQLDDVCIIGYRV